MLHRIECDASEATHGRLVSLVSFGVGCSRVADNLSLVLRAILVRSVACCASDSDSGPEYRVHNGAMCLE